MAQNQRLFAVIVIGGQNIFLQVVDQKNLQIIENTKYDIDLGEDVFSVQVIHSKTVNEITAALLRIKQLLDDYQIHDYEAFATHSFHEADNAEFVREQLSERTGFYLKWLSQSQEALYRNQATLTYMANFPKIIKKSALLIDISSGSVELTAYRAGKFVFSRNLKLGPLRVYEVMRDMKDKVPNFVEVLRDYVSSQLVDFVRLSPSSGPFDNVILMGSAISIFEPMIQTTDRTVQLTINEFQDLYDRMIHGSDQYLIKHFQLESDDVPQVLPIMVLLKQLLSYYDIQNIWVAALKLVDGIAVDMVERRRKSPQKTALQNEQILTSAQNLARRYQVEPKHQQFVADISLKLFDRLKKIHGLNQRDRLLLQIAAMVEDVGTYINNHNHYAHSDYIIQHSEILGLSEPELTMVGAIARYHSVNTPSAELSRFDELPIQLRMTIAKLTAILRLADALDDSRQQKIKSISVSLKQPTKLIITAVANDDIELEKWTFKRKGEFFEDVFGLEPILKGRVQI
ncbi:exopolyphosphatase [Agrilactobacillus fermenti]|uniref:Ppx/GppA phosphatase family protein n=1 Tax=Agrilactobacillus fermenti TaxID=2586909 RepID=UPI003A5C2187